MVSFQSYFSLSIILYYLKFLFFLVILYIFLPLPSIMQQCFGFIPICLDIDVGPNLFSLDNCSQGTFKNLQIQLLPQMATYTCFCSELPAAYVATLFRYLKGTLHPIINIWSIFSSRTSIMFSIR